MKNKQFIYGECTWCNFLYLESGFKDIHRLISPVIIGYQSPNYILSYQVYQMNQYTKEKGKKAFQCCKGGGQKL